MQPKLSTYIRIGETLRIVWSPRHTPSRGRLASMHRVDLQITQLMRRNETRYGSLQVLMRVAGSWMAMGRRMCHRAVEVV